ncbi:MAG: DUF1579 domain-containing protein [Bacteroidota bacterium]
MRITAGKLVPSLILALVLAVPSVLAQEKQGDAAMQEMMKKWQEAMTPGAPHKALAGLEGEWNAEVKSWMNGPDAPPSVSQGKCTMKMVFGGRYLEQEFTSEMMNMPFSGMGFTGYDNVNKKYVGFWIDNMSTGMSTMEGSMTPAGDVLTMYGKMDDVTTGEHGKTMKYVTKMEGPDKQVFAVYDLSMDDAKSKMMEIVYTRRK